MITDNEVNRRFVKYMANLIHYNSINYDKKRRMKDSRYPLTLNSDKNAESILLAVNNSEVISPNLKDHIMDHSLYQAYNSLSVQQQQILSFTYVEILNDKQIAEILGVSQQNISKHRIKALTKLRTLIKKE